LYDKVILDLTFQKQALSMKVYYAHETPEEIHCKSMFLAGPSPRNASDYNWRTEALRLLEHMGFEGDVFVPLPRDGEWLPDYDAQAEWELSHLESASAVLFWIPRDLSKGDDSFWNRLWLLLPWLFGFHKFYAKLPGFTTNVEYGMYVKSGKSVLGFPKGARKMRYLATVGRINDIPIFNDLDEALLCAILLAETGGVFPTSF
jgi:hypothetical protein